MRIHQLREQDTNLDLDQIQQTVNDLQQRYNQLFGNQPEITEDQVDWNPVILELKRRLRKEKKTDYATIDAIMKDVCNQWSCDVHKLHDQFVDREGQTPDDWIKSKKIGS
jgi:hypothetical protein